MYERSQIDPSAWLNATIGDGCVIDHGAIVGRIPHAGWTARPIAVQPPAIIGNHVLIGCHAVIYAGAVIDDDCLIGDLVTIREGCMLGRGVRLASHVSVNYETTIGDGTVIMQATHITGRMRIGRRCFIGPLVATMNHREPRQGYIDHEVIGPTIGDEVLIGGGALLLPGITIGDGAVIGAGAIVTKDVPPGVLVLGQAARIVEGRDI